MVDLQQAIGLVSAHAVGQRTIAGDVAIRFDHGDAASTGGGSSGRRGRGRRVAALARGCSRLGTSAQRGQRIATGLAIFLKPMGLLELSHRVFGIAAEIAIGIQRLAVLAGVAGLRQLLLQGLHLGTPLALHQHAVGHRWARGMAAPRTVQRFAERLFVGLALVILRMAADLLVTRQPDQIRLFIERAFAQRIPLRG